MRETLTTSDHTGRSLMEPQALASRSQKRIEQQALVLMLRVSGFRNPKR
jgi:hypothetical protein